MVGVVGVGWRVVKGGQRSSGVGWKGLEVLERR